MMMECYLLSVNHLLFILIFRISRAQFLSVCVDLMMSQGCEYTTFCYKRIIKYVVLDVSYFRNENHPINFVISRHNHITTCIAIL
jgi:hypothetical protein